MIATNNGQVDKTVRYLVMEQIAAHNSSLEVKTHITTVKEVIGVSLYNPVH